MLMLLATPAQLSLPSRYTDLDTSIDNICNSDNENKNRLSPDYYELTSRAISLSEFLTEVV